MLCCFPFCLLVEIVILLSKFENSGYEKFDLVFGLFVAIKPAITRLYRQRRLKTMAQILHTNVADVCQILTLGIPDGLSKIHV